jgi:hypothetical protein
VWCICLTGVRGGVFAGADYNAQTNEHCFVYHYGTTKEAWDWSNLHKLVADDQVQMMGGPKLDLLAPAASQLHMFAPQPMYVEQPLANKGPQGHKKGAKGCVLLPTSSPPPLHTQTLNAHRSSGSWRRCRDAARRREGSVIGSGNNRGLWG